MHRQIRRPAAGEDGAEKEKIEMQWRVPKSAAQTGAKVHHPAAN
jgi:hypothetical protein